ncbi:MAG: DUF4271 domain-containing protein, partial [Bacteroidales bacterium]|nr:DUF4271 domain-containing protein [Bacteroidales bacterium]
MEPQINDTISAVLKDSIPDTMSRTEFLFGNIIPLAGRKSVSGANLTVSQGHSEIYRYDLRSAGENVPGSNLNSDFSFAVLAFSFMLFALLSAFARKNLAESLRSLSFSRQYKPPALLTSVTLTWPPMAMNLFTVLILSLFTVTAAIVTGTLAPLPGIKMIRTFALFVAVFTAAPSLRHLSCIIIASVTAQKKLFRESVSVVFNTWFIAAIFSFLFTFLIVFTPLFKPVILVYICGGLIVLLLFLRIIKLLYIFIRKDVSLLYFILYLCA